MKNRSQRTATTNKNQILNAVVAEFFQYRCIFLKCALTHGKKSADVCEVCGKHLRQTFLMLRVQRVRVMRTGRKVNRVIKRTEKTKSEGHRKRDFSSKSFFLEACAGRQEGCRYVWRVWETF